MPIYRKLEMTLDGHIYKPDAIFFPRDKNDFEFLPSTNAFRRGRTGAVKVIGTIDQASV
jgi:hypothetical protein